MMLIRLISWPYFRRHTLRTVLTTAGIVLGVAVFLGMHAANQSVLSAFYRTIDQVAGKADLQVSAGEAGFDEDVLERVQAAPSVAVAVPIVEAVVDTSFKGQGHLLILGVDLTGDRRLRDYDLESADEAIVDDPLVFLAQRDSIIVTREFAGRNALAVGSTLPLWTAAGEVRFIVRGILKPSGVGSAFGANLAVMDVYAAQKMFGRGRKFDRIDLAVKAGRTIADCQQELRERLGSGFQIDFPSQRGEQFEALLASYSLMVNISSLFALVIAMFIIYNSFLIAVTERRTEIGILRALGATQRQIWRLYVGEGAVMGIAGSIVGVAVGLLLARGISSVIGQVIRSVYSVDQEIDGLGMKAGFIGSALLVGIVTSVIAAVIPARSAARVDPVRALQKGKYQVLSAGESRTRTAVSAALGAVSTICLAAGGSRPVFYIGYCLMIIVALLLCPLLTLGLAKVVRPLLAWLRPVEGALAADGLIQGSRRTSASVAALMLSLALVVAFAGMARASYNSISDWVDAALNQDLLVTSSENLVARTFRFPSSAGAELSTIPGAAIVQPIRNARILFRRTPVMVVAVEMASVARTARQRPVAGDADNMYRLAAAGKGLVVSDTLARLQGLKFGETIEVQAPYGAVKLPIVGIIVDYSDPQGSILIDRALFEQRWHDDSANIFRVYLQPGVQAAVVKQRILERFPGWRIFVLTNAELRAHILDITDQWVGLTFVQIAVAVLVAILGIVNTLTVSITDRRRELGVLQAVGGRRGQVRLTIWIEALSIGGIGLALGLVLGATNLHYLLQIVQNDIAGIRLNYEFPVKVALVLVPTMLGAALVAALWPAESAIRRSLVEALEYE